MIPLAGTRLGDYGQALSRYLSNGVCQPFDPRARAAAARNGNGQPGNWASRISADNRANRGYALFTFVEVGCVPAAANTIEFLLQSPQIFHCGSDSAWNAPRIERSEAGRRQFSEQRLTRRVGVRRDEQADLGGDSQLPRALNAIDKASTVSLQDDEMTALARVRSELFQQWMRGQHKSSGGRWRQAQLREHGAGPVYAMGILNSETAPVQRGEKPVGC
jgi:hypothetical protein